MPKKTRGLDLRFVEAHAVDLDEPSDVVALPGGALLVVSDTESAALVVRPGARQKPSRVALPGGADGASGFEALAYDAGAGALFVAAEEARTVLRYRWKPGRGAALDARVDVALPGGKKAGRNKGVEGMAFLARDRSPTGRAALLLAREGKPRALFLLDERAEGEPVEVELDERLLDACDDFSGLAVVPSSGRVMVCSDESACLAEVAFAGSAASPRVEFVGATRLEGATGKRVERAEGVAVDEAGAVWVLLEDARELLRYERVGGRP